MRIPPRPPFDLEDLSRGEILQRALDATVRVGLAHPLWLREQQDRYLSWDELRRRPRPPELSAEEAWLALLFERVRFRRPLPHLVDGRRRPWDFWLTDTLLERGTYFERTARDPMGVASPRAPVTEGAEALRLAALREEAIWSSLIEGAATTRRAGEEMLRHGRRPQNRGEQMILNNFRTMEWLREAVCSPLTPETVLEIHHRITEGCLDDPDDAGRLQSPGEKRVVVQDAEGATLHTPPPAEELPERLQRLCAFANADRPFLPSVIRASLLHFQLAFDHPFVDGNGRTARALFYWLMLREGHEIASFVTISEEIGRSKAAYGVAYLRTEVERDVGHFVSYNVGLYERAVAALHDFAAAHKERVQRAEESLPHLHNLNGRQRLLLRHALRHSRRHYSANEHAALHAVTHQSAMNDLRALERLGYLRARRVGKSWHFTAVSDLDARVAPPADDP